MLLPENKICVVHFLEAVPRALKCSSKYQMIEYRMDNCNFSNEELQQVIIATDMTIATARPGQLNDNHRLELLRAAAFAGAEYIDIEYNSTPKYLNKAIGIAESYGSIIILSAHYHTRQPAADKLKKVLLTMSEYPASILKLVTTPESVSDISELKAIYPWFLDNIQGKELICFGMGNVAQATRFESLSWGSPFTYCHADGYEPAAPGQLSYSEMLKKLSGGND